MILTSLIYPAILHIKKNLKDNSYRSPKTFKFTELKKDLSSGFFLLIFLTAKLSKFDVIPNYWAPLKFWDWNTLFSIPRVEPKRFDLKEIIGVKIKSYPKV